MNNYIDLTDFFTSDSTSVSSSYNDDYEDWGDEDDYGR